jgi:RNA polymerase sigma-70 factor (family 1)
MHGKEHYDEVALVKDLQQGSAEAFIQLYNHYHPALYSFVIKFIKVPELAEDILQEIFLKLWKIRERVNPELSFQAYLYRISRNLVYDRLKQIAADKELCLRVIMEFQFTIEDTENKARWSQYQSLLKSAISQLPPQRQKIFKLCREEGKTYKDVSHELNISPNTVKEHMVLAVKSIKDYFYRYGDISFIAILLIDNNI